MKFKSNEKQNKPKKKVPPLTEIVSNKNECISFMSKNLIMWRKPHVMNAFIRSRYAKQAVTRLSASNDKNPFVYSIIPHQSQSDWPFHQHVNTISQRFYSHSTQVCTFYFLPMIHHFI